MSRNTLDALLTTLLSGPADVVAVCAFVDLLKDAEPDAATAAISRLLSELASARETRDALIAVMRAPVVGAPVWTPEVQPWDWQTTTVTTHGMGEEGGGPVLAGGPWPPPRAD